MYVYIYIYIIHNTYIYIYIHIHIHIYVYMPKRFLPRDSGQDDADPQLQQGSYED